MDQTVDLTQTADLNQKVDLGQVDIYTLSYLYLKSLSNEASAGACLCALRIQLFNGLSSTFVNQHHLL